MHVYSDGTAEEKRKDSRKTPSPVGHKDHKDKKKDDRKGKGKGSVESFSATHEKQRHGVGDKKDNRDRL